MYDIIIRVRSWILEYLVIVKSNEDYFFINNYSYSFNLKLPN
jgi:hypothetical protein